MGGQKEHRRTEKGKSKEQQIGRQKETTRRAKGDSEKKQDLCIDQLADAGPPALLQRLDPGAEVMLDGQPLDQCLVLLLVVEPCKDAELRQMQSRFRFSSHAVAPRTMNTEVLKEGIYTTNRPRRNWREERREALPDCEASALQAPSSSHLLLHP